MGRAPVPTSLHGVPFITVEAPAKLVVVSVRVVETCSGVAVMRATSGSKGSGSITTTTTTTTTTGGGLVGAASNEACV